MSENKSELLEIEDPESFEGADDRDTLLKLVKENTPEQITDYILKIKKETFTDELTGLLNKRGVESLAKSFISGSKRYDEKVYIFYIDLDELKKVNDNKGHQEGDKLLQSTAEALKESFRENDLIARVGGDEFAVLASVNLQEDGETGVENEVFESIFQRFFQKMQEKGDISISCGFTEVDSIEVLNDAINKADERMYLDKGRFERK